MSDDLQPLVNPRALPDEVGSARRKMAEVDGRDRLRYEANIAAHLSARRSVLEFLEREHQRIADGTDLDLVAATRPAAAWQMAGRCVGIARLILDAVELGYCSELMHLARALHEADRLLNSFEDPEEDALLRKWLADVGADWVRPTEARNAMERTEQRLAAAAREAGGPELRTTKQLSIDLYDLHSQAAHHRRRWVEDAVFPDERTMMRGRTQAWIRRAVTARAMTGVVDESILCVGNALRHFHERGWFVAQVAPLIDGFEALDTSHPLPPH
ncbi:MAG: hypothetical protein WAP35_00745 [Solirubrobacterales bacterium]